VQAWVFSEWLEPKPPLYDLLVSLPPWTLWTPLLMRLALLNALPRATGMDLLGESLLREVIVIVYLYVVATLAVVVWDSLGRRRTVP